MDSVIIETAFDALLTVTSALFLFGYAGLTAEDANAYMCALMIASMFYQLEGLIQITSTELKEFEKPPLTLKKSLFRKSRIIHTWFLVSSFFVMVFLGADSCMLGILVYIIGAFLHIMLQMPEMKRSL